MDTVKVKEYNTNKSDCKSFKWTYTTCSGHYTTCTITCHVGGFNTSTKRQPQEKYQFSSVLSGLYTSPNGGGGIDFIQ